MLQNIKKKYPLVLSRINQLVERIKVLGPTASIDVDQAALRVTLDVIGLVSANGNRINSTPSTQHPSHSTATPGLSGSSS